MSEENQFICVIGTDGSGKTTQCKSLIETIKQETSVTYAWCKFESALLQYAVSGIKRIYSASGEDMSNYDNRTKKKDGLLSRVYIRYPFFLYILLHYYTQVLRDVWTPLLRDKTVVCDRYVYDTVVDVAVDFGLSNPHAKKLLSLYLAIIPTPDVVIYIDVPPEVSMERKDDIPTIEFVREKKKVYDMLIDEIDHKTIDGTQSIKEIEAEIETLV